jgi:hypothetical protein
MNGNVLSERPNLRRPTSTSKIPSGTRVKVGITTTVAMTRT